jgi:nucleotide-binding universal stress UspA family protein
MLTTGDRQQIKVEPLADSRAILVAVRGPLSVNPSIEWAARRAHATETLLTLVHAVPSADMLPPGTPYEGIVASGRVLLQTEAERLSHKFPGLRVGTYLHCGDVVHALMGLSSDAALLVVGADRQNAVTGVFKGSVAVEVALGSLAPVLIIPTGHRENGDRNGTGHAHVVVGIDGSDEARGAVLRAAAEAHRMGAALRVVAATRPEAPLSERESAGTAALLLDIRTTYPTLTVSWVVDLLRPPARALIRHSRDAALLVIGRHGRGARPGMLLGSVTHTLLLRPPCPMLVVTSPRAPVPVPAPEQ